MTALVLKKVKLSVYFISFSWTALMPVWGILYGGGEATLSIANQYDGMLIYQNDKLRRPFALPFVLYLQPPSKKEKNSLEAVRLH